MSTFDLYDFPVRQDDPAVWEQFRWASSPVAIVQVVEPPAEDPWNHRHLMDAYPWILEITLDEADAGIQLKRFASQGGAIVETDRDESVPADSEKGTSLPEKLEYIRANLGIGMKYLAAALNVKRPTAYAWIKGERLPQPKRWERVRSLAELADYWLEMSRHPLSRRIFVPTKSGVSVMDLLAAEALDIPRIKDALKNLATDEDARSARLKEKAVAMRERMKAKGAKPLSDEVVEQTMRSFANSEA